MKRLLSPATLILFLGVGCSHANAQVVFSQSWDGSSNLTASQNDTNGLGNFITYYDDFTLGTNTAITKATWVGGYFNPATVGPITGFTLTFSSDNSGIPGSTLMTESISGKAGETAAPGSPVNGIPIFDYSTTLPTSFTAMADTRYWLSIVPDLGYPPQWGLARGTGGDGVSFLSFSPHQQFVAGDMAFSLTGTATPEPGVCALIVSLGLSAAFLRRKRTKNAL